MLIQIDIEFRKEDLPEWAEYLYLSLEGSIIAKKRLPGGKSHEFIMSITPQINFQVFVVSKQAIFEIEETTKVKATIEIHESKFHP